MQLYRQDVFPQFVVTEITDESGLPKRSIFKIVSVKGIG